jgi:signal transduction histidine kinase
MFSRLLQALEKSVPDRARKSPRTISRYIGVYFTMYVLAIMIAGIIPFVFALRGPIGSVEMIAIWSGLAAPLLSILVIRKTGSLVAGMLLASTTVTVLFTIMALNTGGVASFVIPWFLTVIAIQALFGNRWSFYLTSAVLTAVFIFLFVVGQLGLLPENTIPPDNRAWLHLISFLTAIAAITWVASIGLKRRISSKETLRQAQLQAETANQAKSQFISSMSHELRTPLNAVIGFSQVLRSDLEDRFDAEHLDSVEQINGAGRLLLGLVNQILDLSKIEAGELDISLEDVELNHIVDSSIDLVSVQAAEMGITVVNEVGDGIYIHSDQLRMSQVFLNLISNAVKYNKPQGKVTLRSADGPDNTVSVSVCDTGQGIPHSRINELFQPFNRLGAENSGIEGTGIGLVITEKLVTAMNGSVAVKSVEGEGTTFTVNMPLSEQRV